MLSYLILLIIANFLLYFEIDKYMKAFCCWCGYVETVTNQKLAEEI